MQAGREALERVIQQAQAALDKMAESSGLCLAVTRRNAQEVHGLPALLPPSR